MKKIVIDTRELRTLERDIVGAYILSNDGYLLLGRNRKGGVYDNTWVVPGGGVEEGETLEAAVKREVAEETGIDISKGFTSKLIGLRMQGESPKLLEETEETVLAKMKFHAFIVQANKPADSIPVACSDDLVEAEWFPIAALAGVSVSPPTRTVLIHLGYLPELQETA